MIEHIWSVICSRMITDQETKNVSLIDIIEEITLQIPMPPVPEGESLVLTVPITTATVWRREPEDQPAKGRGRICLLLPQQEVANQISVYNIDLSDKLRVRAYGTLPGIPFRGPGTYRFIVQLQNEGETEWETVASIPVRIIMRQTTATDLMNLLDKTRAKKNT